jgi:hypothetical protein
MMLFKNLTPGNYAKRIFTLRVGSIPVMAVWPIWKFGKRQKAKVGKFSAKVANI